MTGGSTDEIHRSRGLPEGPLRYVRVDGRPQAAAASHDRLPVKDRPLVICGDLMVVDPKCRELTREGVLRFCIFRAIENKPFWDNSHRRIAFAERRRDTGRTQGGHESRGHRFTSTTESRFNVQPHS
jgi:CDGSH-type Zn-finger protein